jgi:hypothetical protein
MDRLLGLSIMLMAVPALAFLVANIENAIDHWPVALLFLAFAVGCIIGGATLLVRRPFR